MRKSLTEFIGTFFLCLVFLLTVNSTSLLAPFAVAATLITVMYAGGHHLIGHYNPAISLAAWVRGRLTTTHLVWYIIVQLLTPFVAVYVANRIVPFTQVAALAPMATVVLLGEGLFAFLLCYTFLNVATARNASGNSYFGFAIGSVQFIAALSVGTVTGALLNPAIVLTAHLAGFVSWDVFAIFVVAHALGGIVAGVAFKVTNPLD